MNEATNAGHGTGLRRFTPYPAYRDSGVDWLGEIPSTWDCTRLRTVAHVNPTAWKPSGKADEEINYLAIADVEGGGSALNPQRLLAVDAPAAAHLSVQPADVFVSRVRTYLGAIGIVREDMGGLVLSGAFAVLRPNQAIDSRFLCWLVRSAPFLAEVSRRSKGVTWPAINPDELSDIRVPLPPLATQAAVAALLDRETAIIDALAAKREKLIGLLQEKHSSLITQTVTKGLDPNVPLKSSGEQWLGEIPIHWDTSAVKRTARRGHKTFTDGDWIEAPFITNDGIRLIQTGNVGIGQYKEQGFRYISNHTFRELGCTEVCPRDVLICRLDGPVGRACLAPGLGVRMITSVDNSILKVNETNNDPRFLVYFMSSWPWLEWIQSICRVGGGFRFRISRSMLGSLVVAVPPLREQKRIADRLDSESEKIIGLADKVREGVEYLEEFRTALIAAAVTGKIDVREEVA